MTTVGCRYSNASDCRARSAPEVTLAVKKHSMTHDAAIFDAMWFDIRAGDNVRSNDLRRDSLI